MRNLAADLRATGEIREDLTDQQVADVNFRSMNATEYWDLLVRQRGWESDPFARWLADAWTRLLLAIHEQPPTADLHRAMQEAQTRPLIGYLFHCLMTGAWRGSV